MIKKIIFPLKKTEYGKEIYIFSMNTPAEIIPITNLNDFKTLRTLSDPHSTSAQKTTIRMP